MGKIKLFASLLFVTSLSHSQNLNFVYGEFNVYHEKIITPEQIKTRSSASAYFSQDSFLLLTPNILCDVGQVKLNNKRLKFNAGNKFYGSHLKKNNSDPNEFEDEYNNISLSEPMNWRVYGNGNIPDMNFIYNGPFPSFSSNVNLPSVINKSDTLILSIGEVSDADTIQINIWDSYLNNNTRKFKLFSYSYDRIPYINGKKTIKIAGKYLIDLIAGETAFISVEAVKQTNQIVFGKKFRFKTSDVIIRPLITIVNQ